MKVNCWTFIKCGREYGGGNVKSLGRCPAATYTAFNQTNGGFNGGRYCWQIAGTFPSKDILCSHTENIKDCTFCKFYKLVEAEEDKFFIE